MEQFLPDGITGEDVITLLAAASAFLVMMAVWSTGIIKDGMDGRIKSLQDRRSDLKRGYVAPVKRRQTIKQKKHVGLMHSLVNSFNLLKNEQAEKFQLKLTQAGYRIRSQRVNVLTGIEAVRRRLRSATDAVTLTIHPRCRHLIESVQRYHYTPRRDHDHEPVKDGPDHACDALRYLITSLDQVASRPLHIKRYA